MAKKALITGQDGSYLAEHLLGLGYEVHGLVRPVAMEDQEQRSGRIAHLRDRIALHPGTEEISNCELRDCGNGNWSKVGYDLERAIERN